MVGKKKGKKKEREKKWSVGGGEKRKKKKKRCRGYTTEQGEMEEENGKGRYFGS